jgi:hypothetical protein
VRKPAASIAATITIITIVLLDLLFQASFQLQYNRRVKHVNSEM